MSDQFVGEIRLFGFPRIPDGWLACDGSSQSISQYQTLFTLIGTTYGGNGTTTFNLPDLRGRVPIGQGQGPSLPNYVIGQTAGQEAHTLINNELPAHSHALVSSTDTANSATPAQNVHLATASTGNFYAPATSAAPYELMAPSVGQAGQSLPHNNMMPTLVSNYCIAWAGIYPSQG